GDDASAGVRLGCLEANLSGRSGGVPARSELRAFAWRPDRWPPQGSPPSPTSPASGGRGLSMRRITSLYLGGPDAAMPDGVMLMANKRALCAGKGFVGMFPEDGVLVETEPS